MVRPAPLKRGYRPAPCVEVQRGKRRLHRRRPERREARVVAPAPRLRRPRGCRDSRNRRPREGGGGFRGLMPSRRPVARSGGGTKMGTLIAVKYPTKLFLKLFDHTYVMCGTGRVRWPCWGGSSGGTAFRSATGSTMRAALIAGADGRAGIACYLVNGVCHQAANRILSAGEATVRGARGYWVSTALYGAYGRSSGVAGTCASPFAQHLGVTGDLPDCIPGPGAGWEPADVKPARAVRRAGRLPAGRGRGRGRREGRAEEGPRPRRGRTHPARHRDRKPHDLARGDRRRLQRADRTLPGRRVERRRRRAFPAVVRSRSRR